MNLLQMDSNFPCFLCVQAKEIDRLVRKICMDPPTAQNQAMAAYSSEDPLLERRMMKPQPEQALKCPRCDSTNTKFCYYNNYSLSQPRYFCKSCRRYWTKGGTLRNVPVGGGCRKKKRIISKKPQGHPLVNPTPNLSSLTYDNSSDLTLAFTRIQKQPLKQLGSDEHDTTVFGTTTGILGNPNSNLCFLDKIRSGFGLGGNQDSNQYTLPVNFNNFSTFSHENVEGGVEGYCKSRDEENRIWGLGGSIVDAARDYWSGAGSWHGLANSFGPSSVSSLM